MLSKNPVLKSLGLLTKEDILKLSSAEDEVIAFKQAAGGEWVTQAKVKPRKPSGRETTSNIISFPKKSELTARQLNQLAPMGEDSPQILNDLSMDFILTQRDLWKQMVKSIGIAEAINEYLLQLRAISIKERNAEGKMRIRFISTKGILVDKKQS